MDSTGAHERGVIGRSVMISFEAGRTQIPQRIDAEVYKVLCHI